MYKHSLLTLYTHENQAFSVLRRLRWIEAAGSTSVFTAVEQMCWVVRGPCRNMFLASETAGGEQGWTLVYLTLVLFTSQRGFVPVQLLKFSSKIL